MGHHDIHPGMTVRTAATLEPWTGIGEGGPTVRQRRPNTIGTAVDRSTGLAGTRYVQHEGDACLTLYRETELTPATEPAATPFALPNLAAIEARFEEVAAHRLALGKALGAFAEAFPAEGPWSILRRDIERDLRDLDARAHVDRWKQILAQAKRERGPAMRLIGGSGPNTYLMALVEYQRRTKTSIFALGPGGDEVGFNLLTGTMRGAFDRTLRLHPDDLAMAQTTEWAPPKPSEPANKKT